LNVRFKRADMDDVGALCKRGMRRADELEVLRMGRLNDPYLALAEGVMESDAVLAAYTDNGIACIVGVHKFSVLGDHGVIWLLGHDDLERYAVRFLKESRRVLSSFLGRYSMLENFVDAENVLTLRWLEWLGFTIDKDKPITTPLGYPFYHVWKEASHV
jgi:hypothetical protein